MRLLTSKTLLAAVAGLIAVPGAAIAAADPGAALLEVGSSNEEVDCEEYGDDRDGPDAEVPEECLPQDEQGADEGEDGTEGDEDGEDAAEDDEVQDGSGGDDESEDGSEGDDAGEGDEVQDGSEGDDESEDVESDTGQELDEAPISEELDEGETSDLHGEIVSTVAHCAPRGQERVDGFDLANHGAYVSTAAQSGMLSVAAGEFDLSTLDGAQALCDAIDGARTAVDEPSVVDEDESEAAVSTDSETASDEQRGDGPGNGKGAARQDGGPGNSGNAPGRNR